MKRDVVHLEVCSADQAINLCLELKTPSAFIGPAWPKTPPKVSKIGAKLEVFFVRPGDFQVSLPRFRLCDLQPAHLKVKQAEASKEKHFAVINGRIISSVSSEYSCWVVFYFFTLWG